MKAIILDPISDVLTLRHLVDVVERNLLAVPGSSECKDLEEAAEVSVSFSISLVVKGLDFSFNSVKVVDVDL